MAAFSCQEHGAAIRYSVLLEEPEAGLESEAFDSDDLDSDDFDSDDFDSDDFDSLLLELPLLSPDSDFEELPPPDLRA